MPNVDIPGVGVVAFPDSMSAEAINAAASHAYQQSQGAAASGASQGRQDFNRFLPPALLAGASIGAGLGVDALQGMSPNAIPALAKFAGKQIPGMHTISDVRQLLTDVRGAAPPPIAAAAEATQAGIPKGRELVTQELIDRIPALRNYRPGETISHQLLDKAKMESSAKGNVPSRAIKVQGKPEARAPIPTEEPAYTGGRGASGPELARRSAQFGKGRPPQIQSVTREIPNIPPAASLEDQMRQAIELARLTGPSERGAQMRAAVGRAAAGAGLPPELEMLMALQNAALIPQQMDASRQMYQQGLTQNSPQHRALLQALLQANPPQGF